MKLEVVALSWVVPEKVNVVECEFEDESILMMQGVGEIAFKNSLPTEFFSNELFSFNEEDEVQLSSFVQTWGFLVNPIRYSMREIKGVINENPKFKFMDETLGRSWLDELEAIALTDELRRLPRAFSVSVEEVKGAVVRLRGLAKSTQKIALSHDIHDLDDVDKINFSFMERANTPQFVSQLDQADTSGKLALFPPMRDANLTHAVCNQMHAFLADEANARVCACEGCERIFKRKRGTASILASSVSDYCSVKCENRQRSRRYRATRK